MSKRLLGIRIAADVLISLLGIALSFGAWVVLGVAISAVHITLSQALSLSFGDPTVREEFQHAHHSFDSYRLFFSAIGLFLVIIGCSLFAVDVRARASA
jgi:hypothetical protein